LDEVARLAGVSRSTASRALNGGVASPQTVEAVERARAELGFVPNRAARDLARRRTDSVAIVIQETPAAIFHNPFHALVTTALATRFWEAGLQPLLALMDPFEPEPTVGRILHRGHVDGVVVSAFQESPPVENLLTGSGLPTVFIGRPPRPDSLPYVDVDNRRGAHLATRHLLERGRRRIACLGGPATLSSGVDRRQGWLDAHHEAGIAPGPYLGGAADTASARDQAQRLLRQHPAIDAIVAYSDAVAAGAIQALRAAGRAIPDDIALTGVDNFATATEVCPNLTTVAQPVPELARAAADLLIGYLQNGAWPAWPRILATELIVRDST
jgi:DNA-binding LacI/PurR family transcriptional regulator